MRGNKKKVYLDYNSTTPIDKRVLEEMLPFFTEKFGNASSISHAYGWDAEEGVELARDRVAKLINAKSNEIYFTSGGTESINLALLGICKANESKGNHLITCQTEHKAVLDTCEQLIQNGTDITYLPVSKSGNIDLQQLQESITKQTIAVCLMHANNEIGTIHPLAKISKITRESNVLLVTDASQSAGKIPLDVDAYGVDIAILSAHKMYGPKGVGALYVRSGVQLTPMHYGGGQERKLRPGTLNTPGIVGFGKAAELCHMEMQKDADRLQKLIELIEYEFAEEPGIHINGENGQRLPHVTNLTFENIDGSRLIRTLKNLAVSQSSACSSNTLKPSHVLTAIGHDPLLALSSLRIGIGRFTTKNEVRLAIGDIMNAVDQLKLTAP